MGQHSGSATLSDTDFNRLLQGKHQCPHQVLGMHPLSDGSGVVVRVFHPNAKSVQAAPCVEKDKPRLTLEPVHSDGLFEAVTHKTSQVYAYDLVVTETDGTAYQQRDPYSFLASLSETDLYLFNQGNERRVYDKLGSHLRTFDGVEGVSFAVWAPNAKGVSVVGEFNQWDGRRHPMRTLGLSGVWELFIPGISEGSRYKYEIRGHDGSTFMKTDPYAFYFEVPPNNASIVWDNQKFEWTDQDWMEERQQRDPFHSPMSIYEVHPGSWQRKSDNAFLSYRELAEPLIEYVKELGFTHVEFLPVAEHAYLPSWGYQVTGFYAPTSRYGSPEDFQYLVNALHEAGIGVIIDWVPAHFPRDIWALAQFDGTALYEHEDPRQGAHRDWGTLIFNFGRHEVRNFLTANGLFWIERFHIDGLRVDAVASMLYLDYSREDDDWVPNRYGGRENLEAVEFLREINHLVHTEHPGAITIAEESTAWPQVTRPPYVGGLGFSFKWNMGWMHDTLLYFQRDPIYRKYHQNDLTFTMLYHYGENFLLPLSHDEVVHGKGSLLQRMPGDEWQRFANLRSLLAYQWLFPGKKLLFMGGEFGQSSEWSEAQALEWHLLEAGRYHRGAQRLVADCNQIYLHEPALFEADYDVEGFFWVDCSDHDSCVLSFVRQSRAGRRQVLVILNLTPVARHQYRIGLPQGGSWQELLNTDAGIYGGSNQGNLGGVEAESYQVHNQPFSAAFTLPPLSVSVFRPAAVSSGGSEPKPDSKSDTPNELKTGQ